MSLFLLACACALVGGYALSRELWRWSDASGGSSCGGPAEGIASAITMTFLLVLGASWALALVHVLTRETLAGVLLAIGLGGVSCLVWRAREGTLRIRMQALSRRDVYLSVLVLLPLALWIEYVLFRGWVLPVVSHDALSHHLPRAVLIVRAHGYEFFDSTTMTISAYPANYELLLADVILLTGSDRVTEWVCTAGYVYLLSLSGALAERWWGKGVHVFAAVLLTAVAPVSLLHSGAHKDDLLMSAAVLAAILWGASWAAHGGLASFVLAYGATSIAVGTKLSSPFLIAGLLPSIGWRAARWWRQGRRFALAPRTLATVTLAVVAMTFLLGSDAYLANLRAIHSPFPVHNDFGFDEGYGDWANLVRVPYLIFTRPFSSVNWGVWVPWRNEYWFWPEYDLYASSLGVTTTLMLLLLPLGIWRYARKGDPEARAERVLATIAGLVVLLLIMPIKSRPLGFFMFFTRYLMYVPPILACWTVAPRIRDAVGQGARGRALGWFVLVGLSTFFAFEGVRYASRDSFASLDLVAAVLRHPELERTAPDRPTAAGIWVDHVAGPDDVIAFDGVVDAWIYPAFGRDLTRPVIALHVRPNEEVAIPPDAKWVVIDRNWNTIWGAPDFRDMGQVRELLFHGTPKPTDLQLFRQLLKDSHFRLVYRDRPTQQAVFERVSS